MSKSYSMLREKKQTNKQTGTMHHGERISCSYILPSPANQPFHPIEAPSKLTLRLDHLTLQHRVPDDILAICRPNPRQPNALRCLPQQSVSAFATMGISPVSVQTRRWIIAPTIDHHVGRVSMSSDVADKIDAHAAGTLVAEIAIETQRPEMALEFPSEDGC